MLTRYIAGFEGLWANEATLEACREELQEALEDWILLGVSMNHELPTVVTSKTIFQPPATPA